MTALAAAAEAAAAEAISAVLGDILLPCAAVLVSLRLLLAVLLPGDAPGKGSYNF